MVAGCTKPSPADQRDQRAHQLSPGLGLGLVVEGVATAHDRRADDLPHVLRLRCLVCGCGDADLLDDLGPWALSTSQARSISSRMLTGLPFVPWIALRAAIYRISRCVRTEIRAGTSARCSSIISSSGMLHSLPGYATIRRVYIERLCISRRRRGD